MTAAIKALLNDTSLFRKLYITVLFFCNIYYVMFGAYIALVPMVVWGFCLVIKNQKRYHTFTRTRFGLWLGAFIAVSIIGMLFNYTFTVLYSVAMLFHVLICFFIFYGMHTEPGFNFREELYFIARVFIYLTVVLNIISLLCLMFGIKYENGFFKIIIFENRFTGFYMNPNILGFVSVIALVCCHIVSKSRMTESVFQPRISKIWVTACAVTNIFTLILSDSNASLVLLLGYSIAYIAYLFFADKIGLSPKKIALKLVSLIIAGVFIVGFSLMFRSIVQTGFAVITSKTTSLVQLMFYDGEIPIEEFIQQSEESASTFEHENTNVDSGRMKLWKEGAELFKLSPVIGISSGNIVYYSQEYLNGSLNYRYHNHDLHNGYLTILVSTGILGFAIFCCFGFRFTKHSAQHLFLQKKTYRNDAYPCLFCFLFAYLIYSIFEKTLLYDITFIVVWFWLMMGYTSCYVAKTESALEGRYIFGGRLFTRNML